MERGRQTRRTTVILGSRSLDLNIIIRHSAAVLIHRLISAVLIPTVTLAAAKHVQLINDDLRPILLLSALAVIPVSRLDLPFQVKLGDFADMVAYNFPASGIETLPSSRLFFT